MTSQTSLNLDDDSALLRGIEYADAELVARFVRAINEMREPVRYSNQDFDRRSAVNSYMTDLRKIGNTPLKSAA